MCHRRHSVDSDQAVQRDLSVPDNSLRDNYNGFADRAASVDILVHTPKSAR